MTDLTPIAAGLISLLMALITVFVIPMIRAKLSNEKLAELQLWVQVAVKAAEQLYKGNDQGASKKKYVLETLAKHGYTIDDSIDQMIEAAVNELPKQLEPIFDKTSQ